MIEQVNPYTWVVGKNKGILKERYAQKITPTPVVMKPKNYRVRTDEYQEFCQEAFLDRKFICVREFRKMVSEKIHQNHTYYIERMKDLKFIIEEYNVIKPGERL